MAGSPTIYNEVAVGDDDIDNDEPSTADELSSDQNPRKRVKRSRSGNFLDQENAANELTPKMAENPRYVINHVVYCDQRVAEGHDHAGHPRTQTFFDVPRLIAYDNRASHLRGQEQLLDANVYQHQHDDVCLIVCKRYNCWEYHEMMHDKFTKYPIPLDVKSIGPYDVRPWFYILLEDARHAVPGGEYLKVNSEDLQRAMKSLTRLMPPTFKDWASSSSLEFPYSFFYHYVKDIEGFAQQLPSTDQRLISVLLDYIVESQKEDYQEADAMFARRYVSQKHFGKLFKMDDIVVKKMGVGLRAFRVESVEYLDGDDIELQCLTWDFDGRFHETRQVMWVHQPLDDDEEIPLHELKVWPLRLDKSGTIELLRQRGQMFWSLRFRRLVHYEALPSNTFEIRTSNPKYMVDMSAYRDLHQEQTPEIDFRRKYLDLEAMNSNEPPADPFVLMLPPEVKGFGFHDKKWRTLQVSSMKNLTWNKQAFKRLVLKHSKKELIEALVRIHLGSAAPSDIIEDKGMGLIMLLHGPPGTGKTLTAESVAELAEKPLYRITCGDMGTDPESVEKYLESALYIGTMWGCVVLLDEADVFLEERTQTDLVRNALVSVFLRVLEYYDGILILTSNRVGTFDEAFKSRMQLAVHYPTLTEMDRRSIWRDFFRTLDESRVAIDKDELEREVEKLAAHNFNGRQIRNVIKTARQLAVHRTQKALRAKDLEDVIDVANDFDAYITKARGHTDEQWASASRMRASEHGRAH